MKNALSGVRIPISIHISLGKTILPIHIVVNPFSYLVDTYGVAAHEVINL